MGNIVDALNGADDMNDTNNGVNDLTIEEVARFLGQPVHGFKLFLIEEGFVEEDKHTKLLKGSCNLTPTNSSLDEGTFKLGVIALHSETQEATVTTLLTRITSKGLALITKRLGQMNIDVYGMMDDAHGSY